MDPALTKEVWEAHWPSFTTGEILDRDELLAYIRVIPPTGAFLPDEVASVFHADWHRAIWDSLAGIALGWNEDFVWLFLRFPHERGEHLALQGPQRQLPTSHNFNADYERMHIIEDLSDVILDGGSRCPCDKSEWLVQDHKLALGWSRTGPPFARHERLAEHIKASKLPDEEAPG